MKLLLKVVPGTSRNEIAGWLGERLKLRVTAPAQSGRANAAIRKLLAATLNVPPSSIEIVAGGASAQKTVVITGLAESDILQRLNGSKDHS